MSGREQWTSTGITVRQGEEVRFTASGQIQLSADTNDVATPAGARSQRLAPRAPLTQNFAGALIAKIGENGRPFPVGNQDSVRMPDSGELFLGVNDDELSDNRGDFRVAIRRSGISLEREEDRPRGTAGIQPRGDREVRVTGDQRWTPTGLTVRRGEELHIISSGRIQLSADENDVAWPAGAHSQRLASGAPLPEVYAGALIGKIGDNGRPFGIGDQVVVSAPAGGELFLGVNDDELADNRGEYRVEIRRSEDSFRRR